MEEYFVRLSWEIVRACQYHLTLSKIFSPIEIASGGDAKSEDKVKDSPIDGVIKCCDAWKKCYQDV